MSKSTDSMIDKMNEEKDTDLACENCKWFWIPPRSMGECHLNPPTVVKSGKVYWPEVMAFDFCSHLTCR